MGHKSNELLKSYHETSFDLELYPQDFPDGTVVKNPPANAGDTGSSPGLRRSHMARSN